MPEERVYVQFSPALRTLLSSADVDIETRIKSQLERQGLNATVKYERNPTSRAEDKELILLILASGVAAGLVGQAVKVVIDSISRGRHADIKERHIVPALDGKGEPIYDSSGNPVYRYDEAPGAPPPKGEPTRAYIKTALFEVGLTEGEAPKNQ